MINDQQVKEIVEYLSSEDTWSDSYDSSDYTSSDLDAAGERDRDGAVALSADERSQAFPFGAEGEGEEIGAQSAKRHLQLR